MDSWRQQADAELGRGRVPAVGGRKQGGDLMPGKTSKRSRPSRARASKRAPARGRNGASRPRDVIALIKADHATVQRLFRRYKGLSSGAIKSRRNVADRIIKELSVHAAVEEDVLYPVARTTVPNGDELVTEAL